MDELSLGIVLLAAVVIVTLVAVRNLCRLVYGLCRHRWQQIRTHASTRRAAYQRVLLLGGIGLAFVLSFVAVVALPWPTNVWVGAALLVTAVLAKPVCLIAAKGVRPPTPAEMAAIDRTLDERWRRDAGVSVRVVPSANGSQPMTGFAGGFLPGLRYVVVPEAVFTGLSEEALDALFAHERGHIAEYHVALRAVFTPVFVALLAGLTVTAYSRPVVSIGIFGLLLGCLAGKAAFIRWLEYRADAYAARLTDATAMVRVLETLAEQGENDSRDSTDWLDRFFLHHPPLVARTRRLEEL